MFDGEPEEVLPKNEDLDPPFQKIGGSQKLQCEWMKCRVLEDISESFGAVWV